MTDFYISQLQVTGNNVRPAILNFQRGANIIYGNSDEGKSYIVECLDFMFGSKNMRLKASSGYNTITLKVITSQGDIELVRRFNVSAKKSVSIYAHDPRYEKLTCYEQGYEVLGNFWLRLMGFSENQAVITDTYYNKGLLTIKNITSLFLFKETNITSTSSVISSSIRVLAALLLMITGEDYTSIQSMETDAERRQKAKGAKEQIKAIMDDIYDQLQEVLHKMSELGDSGVIETDWSTLLQRFDTQEQQLHDAINRSAEMHSQIETLRKQRLSYRLQRENQHLLQELYDRQAKRLTFTMEGELLTHQNGATKCHCPFCGAESESVLDENILNAAAAEVEQTGVAVRSLQDFDQELEKSSRQLEKKIEELQKQVSELDKEIALSYAPSVSDLRAKMSVYMDHYALQREKDRLLVDYSTWNSRYETAGEKMPDSSRFKVKEKYPKEFWSEMGERLYAMLEFCNLADLKTVSFRSNTMDISVNRQEKKTYGEGFRGIFNMAVSFTLFQYLCEKGVYIPGLLIMDSPIQSMNEQEESKLTSNMISYVCKNAVCGQVFIIDNKFPEETDYADALVYSIGKEGFLPDFIRPARKMTQSELEAQSKSVPGIAVPLPPEMFDE